jgi:hypothetical protein
MTNEWWQQQHIQHNDANFINSSANDNDKHNSLSCSTKKKKEEKYTFINIYLPIIPSRSSIHYYCDVKRDYCDKILWNPSIWRLVNGFAICFDFRIIIYFYIIVDYFWVLFDWALCWGY